MSEQAERKTELTTQELAAIYEVTMNDPAWSALYVQSGLFTVRQWDGMDGCWTDCAEATAVDDETALRCWYKVTEQGTKKIKFNEIDYYRIFPADTRMTWDGEEGREMFRGEENY